VVHFGDEADDVGVGCAFWGELVSALLFWSMRDVRGPNVHPPAGVARGLRSS
jgi:hypothetical protein